MEFKKNIKNHYYIFCVITVGVCFFLGYILLASLDKIVFPTIGELYSSIYTVYTEFGMLIFPVLILQTFTNDYKNKNILFYKMMGYNFFKCLIEKVLVNLLFISIPTIIGIIFVGVIYNDFTNLFVVIFYFESVLIYEVFLMCLWGFLFKNMVLGYIVNFAYWLVSIIASTANSSFDFLVRYDAANKVYIRFGKYLNTYDAAYLDIVSNIMYSIGFIGVILILIYIFRARWEKNGI